MLSIKSMSILFVPLEATKANFHIFTLNNVGVLKVLGDAAGVLAGLHRSRQTSAGPE